MNLCRACGQDFSSVEAFDRHRVGTHGYTLDEGLLGDPPRSDGRRCLSIEQMTAGGWALDARGRRVHPRELRKRLRRGGDTPTELVASPPPTRQPFPDRDELSGRITAEGGES